MNGVVFDIMELRLWALIFPIFALVAGSNAQEINFTFLRQQMVKTQIEARGISDPEVLNAFKKVERHKFVLPETISKAYNDHPLPIEEGQTISQPYIVAFMTDALDLKPTDKILEIGTGSGYQAAILAEICDSVFTIEIFEKLGEKANNLFVELDYKNIFTKVGDGYKGWTKYAPFDAIIVTCSPTQIPKALKEQLAEGGRMIIPVGSTHIAIACFARKTKRKNRTEKYFAG